MTCIWWLYTHTMTGDYNQGPMHSLCWIILHLSPSFCHVLTNGEKAEALTIQSIMKSKIVVGHQKFKLPREVTTLWLYTIKWKYLLRMLSAQSDRNHKPDSLEAHSLSLQEVKGGPKFRPGWVKSSLWSAKIQLLALCSTISASFSLHPKPSWLQDGCRMLCVT